MIAWKYGTITSSIVDIFSVIDYAIYSLASLVLNGIYGISGTVVGSGLIDEVRNRVYVILGIFMLFKLAFSMINAIIEPEKLNDKQNGASKIITRVVVVMGLLMMVPSIFEASITVQDHILKALPQIILAKTSDNRDDAEATGNQIASAVLQAFVHKNDQCMDYEPETISLSNLVTNASMKCPNNLSDGTKVFAYDYRILISSLVGIVMIIFLVLVSVDVAIRVFKFSILQIVAPIPIMSYIDPKSSKDGSFNSWIKECISTYISLFIQLGVVYLVIFLISNIAEAMLSGNGTDIIKFGGDGGTTVNVWIGIFLIIGGFFFMRQAPRYIMKVLGIKDGVGLGIGLGAGLAGMGALLGGAGVLAAAGAIGSQLESGATANAEGKSALTGAFNKGREIAANFNGEEKPQSLMDRMSNNLKRHQAARNGVTDATLDAAKLARNNASNRLSMAESALQEAMQNGTDVQWGDNTYSVDQFRNMLYNGKDSFQAVANSLSSRYDEMNAYGKKMSVGRSVESYTDKYRAKRDDYTFDDPSIYDVPKRKMNTSGEGPRQETIQERINRVANVHESPTREEHQRLAGEYNDFWNSDSVARAVEAEERRQDERNGN